VEASGVGSSHLLWLGLSVIGGFIICWRNAADGGVQHRLRCRRQGQGAPLVHPPPPDLHAAVLKAADATTSPSPASTAISHRSILAEAANLHEQNRRLAKQIRDLEDRLSELLGQHAVDRSGLGAPASTAALHTDFEAERETVVNLRRALEERDEELAAARETNRRLMNQLNRSGT